MFDLLIVGGMVVFPDATLRLDVATRGKEVVALAKPGSLGKEAQRVVDASNFYVLPGAIDPHTHIHGEFLGPTPGFDVMSVACAYGGTTTFIDFTQANSRVTLRQSIDERRAEIDGKTAVDYSLHMGIFEPSWPIIEEIGSIVQYGIPSFKLFLYSRYSRAGGASTIPPDDGFIYAMLKQAKAKKAIVMVHAENQGLCDFFARELLGQGKRTMEYFSLARPNIVEEEAVRRVILLAERVGAAVYFVHLSSREAVAAVAEARNRGSRVYCETCPQYLAFNDQVYQANKAIQFIRFPPIKSATDQSALWQGVQDGTINCIGTDHVAAHLSAKEKFSAGKSFNEVPGGMGLVELLLPFMYSEGVAKGRITINRLVELLSTNPARIFGLYPRKGGISVGSDADMVLLDPKARRKILNSDLHMGLDYNVFEGWELTGEIPMTISKGRIIVEDGKYLGLLADGEFISRSIGGQILA